MNILYNNTRSYNQQYNTTSPKYIKYILKVHDILQRVRTSTCWNIHPATSLLNPAKPTCWYETNKDWDET